MGGLGVGMQRHVGHRLSRGQCGVSGRQVIWVYPAWQRNLRGVSMVISGAWEAGNYQSWREWEFPYWTYDEIILGMCKVLGGKPLGPWVRVREEVWDAEPYIHPQLREPGYVPPRWEDYSRNWSAREDTLWQAGYNSGVMVKDMDMNKAFIEGLEQGEMEGHYAGYAAAVQKGKAKGKGKGRREGKGNRKGKGK